MAQFNSYSLTVASAVAQKATGLPIVFESQMYVSAGTKFDVSGVPVVVAQDSYLNANPATIPVVALGGQIVAGTMFTIEIDDNARIRKHLGLPLNMRVIVESQMALVTRLTPSVVGTVQNVLAELDALEASLKALAQDSSNTSLVKAGPLEWPPFSKTTNVEMRMSSLRSELTGYLDLGGWVGGGGNAGLYRS